MPTIVSIATFLGVIAAIAAVVTMFRGSGSSPPTELADCTAKPDVQRGTWASRKPEALRVATGLALAIPVVGLWIGAESALLGRNSDHDDETAAQVARCESVILDWLESQRKGRDGIQFWSRKSWVTPVRLFAVRSWEIVDKDELLGTQFTVRIASSTKAGFRIEQLWTIHLVDWDSGNPRISNVEEAVSN